MFMNRQLICLALIAGAMNGWAGATWSKYRVEVRSPKEAATLEDSGLNVLDCSIRAPYASVATSDEDVVKLFKLGLPFSYVGEIEDPTNWIDRHANLRALDYTNQYLTLDQIYQVFEEWRAAYPQYFTRTTIGTTLGNRPIYAWRLHMGRATSTPKKTVVITSLVHAREWVTGSVCMYNTGELLNRALKTREYSALLRNLDVAIIPVINPDGYSYTWTNNRLWRKNRRTNSGGSVGVDVNRNFPTGWGQPGASSQQNSETYRGPSVASERETQAYIGYMATLSRPMAVIDYHAYSELLMWPWGYTSNVIPNADTQRFQNLCLPMQTAIASFEGHVYDTGPIITTIYQASGTTVDHWYQTYNNLATTIETRDTGEFGFQLPTSQILPTQIENWRGFDSMLKHVASLP